MRRALSGALVTALVACASPAPSLLVPSLAGTTEVEQIAFDPSLVGELVPLTTELIRARSENPPGNEARVVAIVAARLRQAGLQVAVLPIGADDSRTNLMALLPGSDRTQAPLLLVGHSDVAPADPAAWSVPPYEGAVRADRLLGRGAADMLSMIALQTMTMVALAARAADADDADADDEHRRTRDIILLVTGDQEGDGRGMQQALLDWPQLSSASYAINEGGFLLQSYLRPGEDLAAIAVAEKGLFQFTIEASGPSGHGATPVKNAAPDRLTNATARLLARDAPFRWTKATERRLKDIGAARGGVEALVLSNPALAGMFAGMLAKETLEATPALAALFKDTCSLTVLEAGLKRNVIPANARATFDCRLLPGTEPAAFHDQILRTIDDPRIALTVLSAAPASASDPDGAVVAVLRARLRRELPATVIATTLINGATDCRFLRAAGVPCYGFIPVRLTRDELDAIHGGDESVRTEELEKGLARLVDVVAALAR